MDALLEAVADELENPPASGEELEEARQLYPTPGDLARLLDRRIVQTEALALLDLNLVAVRDGSTDRLIWTMPPQEGKSQRISRAFPLWLLLHNPNLRIAIISYEANLARRWGRAIRNDIAAHPELGLKIRYDTAAAHEWQLDGYEGGVITAGIGGALTGRPVDVMIIDDPLKGRDEAESETFRKAAWDWWTETGSTRLGPGGAAVLLMTRWHEDDLAGKLLSSESAAEWTHVNIPALADHNPAKGESDPLGRRPGEWLRSARGRTRAMWERIRRQVGSRGFLALYQGRPSPDKGNVWLRQWWRRYSVPLWSQHPDIPGAWFVHECDEVLISADMAFKDTKGSDFVAMGVWVRRGAQVFLVDQICKRLSFTETLTAFTALCAKWPQAAAKLVEDKANGTAVIDSLRKKIPGIIPINPKESKYARASAVAPFIEAGNVFVPEREIALFDVDAFIDEAAGFPRAAHDDQVDEASQALQRLVLRAGQGQAFLDAMKQQAQEAGIEIPTAARDARPTTTTGGRRGPDGVPLPQGLRSQARGGPLPPANGRGRPR